MKVTTLFRRTALWGATVAVVPWTILSPGSASAGSVSYVYDSLGRLTKATYTSGAVITYAYDAAGNRTNVTTTGVPAIAMAAQPLVSAAPISASGARIAPMTDQALGVKATQRTSGPVQLTVAGEDPAVYGWNDRSDRLESMVTTVFESDGTDRLLHLQGYGIDTPNAVGLWLNGTLLGYLTAAEDDALSPPSLWLLPASLQAPGKNTVTLIPKTEGQTWGVTRLGLYSMGSGLGNMEGLSGGDQSHAEGFELHLFSQGPLQTEYRIDMAGWDVNSSDEIEIELNKAPFASLPQTDNQAWGPVSPLWIAPYMLMPGDNQLLINNRYGLQEPWGVRIERILVDGAAHVNTLSSGQAGK